MRTDLAPGSLRRIRAIQFPTECRPWAQRHVASIERRDFTFLHIADPSRTIVATPLPHASPTADQPHIARTIRTSHTPRTRSMASRPGGVSGYPRACGIGWFREFEPRRVHTRLNPLGFFLVPKLTCGKRGSVSWQHWMKYRRAVGLLKPIRDKN